MCGDGSDTMTRANILIASAGTPPALVEVLRQVGLATT